MHACTHVHTHTQTHFLQDTGEMGQALIWTGDTEGGAMSAQLYKRSDFPKGNKKDFRRHSGLRPEKKSFSGSSGT